MYETDEQTKAREEREKREEMKKKQKFEEEVQLLEDLLGMTMREVVFESDINDWCKNTSEFSQRLNGKSQLALVVEDEKGNFFVIYLNERVQVNEYV